MDWAIANPGSLGVYNIYATREAAEGALATLKAERPEYADAEVLRFEDWEARHEAELLAPGLREISSDAYYYALEVLPPLQWRYGDGVNRFCMSEFTSGRITQQYATLIRNGVQRYFTKPVRFNYRETYITTALIEALDAEAALQMLHHTAGISER